jgi:hypothetical protein
VRAAIAGVSVVLLAACSVEREGSSDIRQEEKVSVTATVRSPAVTVGTRTFDGKGKEKPAPARLALEQGTKVIDQANVLSPDEKASLDRRLAQVAGRAGRKMTVVLLRPEGGQSLEMVAWAIAPRSEPSGPVLLVVDVGTGSVRVDGISDPTLAVAVARAIGPDVRGGRVASGISRGLDQVANIERDAA